MRITLPKSIAEKVRRPLEECSANGLPSPHVLLGQVRRGFWDEGTDNIRPATAQKIRKILEKDALRLPKF